MNIKILKSETRILEKLREHCKFEKHLENNLRNAHRISNNTVTYLVKTQNGRQAVYSIPKNIQTKIHQFKSYDFYKLNLDTTVNKLYENKDFKNWVGT